MAMASTPKHRTTSPLLTALLGILCGCVIGRASHNAAPIADLLGAAHDAAEIGGAEEAEAEESALACTSALVIVMVLILLTIFFEEVKHVIEHTVSRDMAPIIESLFGELTVLGFLSLFTFCVTKAGYFEILSTRIFGEEEGEELLELFESVHFALFGVMVIFVLTVLKLVGDGVRLEHEWLQLERESRDEAHVARCVTKVAARQSAPQSCLARARARVAAALYATLPSLKSAGHSSASTLLRYRALRLEFLLERSVDPPFRPADPKNRVPDDFNFGRYLSICMGKVLAHSVHLGIGVWTCAAVFALFFYAVMLAVDFDPVILAWVWAGCGITMFFVNNAFDRRMMDIMQAQSTFNLPSSADQDPESKPLVNSNGVWGVLPPWCSIDMDAYNKSRLWIIKKLTKNVHPNRQDSLHWFEREGPKYDLLLLQGSLISTAIYSATLILTCLPLMYDRSSLGTFALYLVVAAAPVVVSQRQRRNIAKHMTLANCVGTHRKPQGVNEVQIEAKTIKAVRAFLLVNKLLYAAENDLLVGAEDVNGGKGPQILRRESYLTLAVKDPALALSPVERAEIEDLFEGFDTDGSGSVTAEEMEEILSALGAPTTPATLAKIMKILDEDGNGEIVKEEFIDFYARNIYHGRDSRSTRERARDMFAMFDESKDGQITIGEFKATLDAFSYGFTVDEVGALVRELDEDESGTVTRHEFEHLLRKYEPYLTPHAPRDLPVV